MKYFNLILPEIKDAIAILKLDETKVSAVMNRKNATLYGIGILFFPAVVNLFLSVIVFPSGLGAIFSKFLLWPILIPAVSLVCSIFLINFVAEKVFRVKADYIGFFKVAAYSSIVLWATILPFLLDVIGISLGYGFYNVLWVSGILFILLVIFQFLMKEYKLSRKDAGICIAIGFIAYFLFNLILGKILVGSYYRIFN